MSSINWSPTKTPRELSSSRATQPYIDSGSPLQKARVDMVHEEDCIDSNISSNATMDGIGSRSAGNLSTFLSSCQSNSPRLEDCDLSVQQQKIASCAAFQSRSERSLLERGVCPGLKCDGFAHVSDPAARASAVVQLAGGKEQYMNIMRALYK